MGSTLNNCKPSKGGAECEYEEDDDLPVWRVDGELEFHGDARLRRAVAIPPLAAAPEGPGIGRYGLALALRGLAARGILARDPGDPWTVTVDWVAVAEAYDAALEAERRRRRRRRRDPEARCYDIEEGVEVDDRDDNP